jgi:hypothetical protein
MTNMKVGRIVAISSGMKFHRVNVCQYGYLLVAIAIILNLVLSSDNRMPGAD